MWTYFLVTFATGFALLHLWEHALTLHKYWIQISIPNLVEIVYFMWRIHEWLRPESVKKKSEVGVYSGLMRNTSNKCRNNDSISLETNNVRSVDMQKLWYTMCKMRLPLDRQILYVKQMCTHARCTPGAHIVLRPQQIQHTMHQILQCFSYNL